MLERWIIPLSFAFLGIAASTLLRDFSESFIFLLASIGQFTAYVFVSRLRQRGSFFWHAMASIGSNGMWYITLHILNGANAYWLLFIPYVIGIIAGRLTGVNLAQLVESKYELKADATRDDRLQPGQRLDYIIKEPMFWVLAIGLLGYLIYSFLFLTVSVFNAIVTVIGLGILQNFFYALSTRASARGNNWYIATTGLMSGLAFYFSALFLLSKQMDFSLFVPYIIGTTLGSTIGAFISMIIEWTMQLRPDEHLEASRGKLESGSRKQEQSAWKKRLPYAVTLFLATIWVLFHEYFFAYMGHSATQLKFPVSAVTVDLPRSIIMLAAAVVFMLDSALHTVTSRAGNRNHTGYHVASLVPKGFSDFFRISYLSLNTHIPDIVPIAILSGCLGSLCGKDIAERIEKWLQAKMDVEPEKPKSIKKQIRT